MSRLTSLPAIRRARDDATRQVILEYLRTQGSVPAAADALGCARETLQRWCSQLGIDTWEATGRERPVTNHVTTT